MNATAELAVLKTALIKAKAAENAAKEHRLEIEEAILAHFPKDKQEGSVTNADFGISVAYKLTRTVDTDALQSAWEKLSANSQKAFKWKADLDLKQYRAIQDLDPASFDQLAVFVTTKPAKPSVSIKE